MSKLVLIVLDGFPQLSETFILNHIISLKNLGYRTHIMANRKIIEPHHSVVSEYRLFAETTFRTPIPLSRFKRSVTFVNYLLKVFLINPSAVIRSFDKSKYGKSALNGELIISLYPYLKIKKPDFIHCHFGTNGVVTEKVVSVLKWQTPLFVSFHGYDTSLGNLQQIEYSRLFNIASRVFVNSEYLKGKVVNLGCDQSKVSIIPVGILRTNTNVNSNSRLEKILFVTVGRLTEVKGVQFTLKAFKLFLEEHPEANFNYLVIGDGELKEELEALTKKLNIQKIVKFLGAMTTDIVNEYLGKSSVFILTGIITKEGRAETQGLVYQEAAMYGLPLIASNAGGVPEYVLHNTTGLIAQEKDVQDIKEKIKKLYFDAELRSELGNAAKKYAESHFDQMKLTKKMITIYESHVKNP